MVHFQLTAQKNLSTIQGHHLIERYDIFNRLMMLYTLERADPRRQNRSFDKTHIQPVAISGKLPEIFAQRMLGLFIGLKRKKSYKAFKRTRATSDKMALITCKNAKNDAPLGD